MDLDKLYDMAAEYNKFSCKPKERKYKIGEVFDDDKSVRWNREEVERRNKLHEEEAKRLNTEKNRLLIEWIDAVYIYIMQETKVKKEKAKDIYNYLYTEYHSYGLTEVLNHLDDLLYLFKK